jgi:hypothetical protein
MDAILIESRKVQRRFMGTFTALISKLRRIFAETLIFVWVVGMLMTSFDYVCTLNFKSLKNNFSGFSSPKTKKQLEHSRAS